MAMRVEAVILLAALAGCGADTVDVRPHAQDSLLQTWTKALDGNNAQETPITRVVNLLKEMQGTLKKEMDEDEELYEKLACWCNNNKYEKNEAIEAAEAQIASLESKIDQLTAKSAELKTLISETTAQLAADKEELEKATAIRQKQLKAMHQEELDGIQNIENLKAAIMVLGKHHAAFPQVSLLGWSSHHKKGKKDSPLDRQFDNFMRKNDFATGAAAVQESNHAYSKFLQDHQDTSAPTKSEGPSSIWSHNDEVVVSKAMHSASLFLQGHGRAALSFGYAPQSGEILGIMKQLKEEMEADLSEAQKTEAARAAAFDELREAKTAEIATGEKMLEEKKAELAQAEFDLANAKEDLEQVMASLSEDQKALIEMTKNCDDADKSFELRKKSRLEEIQAVSATIEILTSDEARDTFNGAYKFIQIKQSSKVADKRRALAANVLRNVAKKSGDPQLSVLATSVELDAFTKIKKMIDEMIAKLKIQQADEVKKKDWCDSELQENTMQIAKAEDLRKDQETSIEDLQTSIKTLTDEIAAAKKQIAEMQLDLQRAGELRVKENQDFQKTVADQVATQEILAKALDKLANFYDLMQVKHKDSKHEAQVANKDSKHSTKQPAQMDYKKSAGGSGVMSMIEKLIYDAKELEAESKKSESEAQTAYETMVADTNAAVAELQAAVVTKTETKAKEDKELVETQEALENTVTDLEDLDKYKAGLHEDCDYLLKNFQIRQESRQAEIEAMQQAKQILSGAA